jgi:hypothetical protein
VALGIKYAATQNVTIAWEFGWRKTFTDYLDDVSTVYPDLNLIATQNSTTSKDLSYRGYEVTGSTALPAAGTARGNPNNKDWYMLHSVSLIFKL